MADTWAASWAQSRAAEAQRFNMTHVPAGSATGGQFGTSSGGSSAKSAAKAPAKTPAKAAPAHQMSAAHAAEKARLLAQAHKDAAEAAVLEKQLAGLEKQAATASAAAKKSAASAKASLKAGHVVHHRKHAAHHAHHSRHHQSLKQKITALKGRIHALRVQAAGLEKQANAIRSAGAVTNPGGTERLHEYWVHGDGAAKIRWGEGGDFDRCVMHLGKFVKDPKGYCAQAHHDALGIWPATHAAMEHKAGRADMAKQDVLDKPAAPAVSRVEAVFSRIWELEDIRIVSRAQGDGSGRLVEAYAAVFNVPAEIHDQHGDYNEKNDPGSFNRSIDHASTLSRLPFRCIYNHGMTLHGTPSDRGSIPIGTPEEVRAESRGLLTRTRYNETSLADEVLEAIRSGGITAQSYTGRILRSDPELRRGEKYRAGRDGRLPTVRRLELMLREYGPTPFPAFSGAEILGVRMSTPGSWSPDPDEHDDAALPPDEEPAAGDPLTRTAYGASDEHSARYHQHALYVLRSKEAREKAGLVF